MTREKMELIEDLCDIAWYGVIEKAERLLDNPRVVRMLDVPGRYWKATPLHLALRAKTNSLEMTDLLLKAKARPNVTNDHKKKTPLHYATDYQEIFGKNIPAIQLLLTSRANPNYQDYLGRLPLHYAVAKENLEDVDSSINIVRLLLGSKSSINTQDYEGRTPLHLVADSPAHERYKIMSLLLEAKADVHKKDKRGSTALHYALLSERRYALPDSETPEMERIGDIREDPDVQAQLKVQILLDAGANPHARDNEQISPIEHAILRYRWEELELLAKKAKASSLNQPGFKGSYALHLAIRNSLPSVEILLRTNKVNVNLKDRKGNTPLHLAIMKIAPPKSDDAEDAEEDNSLVTLLLENRANFMIRNAKGQTPLTLLPNPPVTPIQREIRNLFLPKMGKITLLSSLHPRVGKKTVVRKATPSLLDRQVFRIIITLAYGPLIAAIIPEEPMLLKGARRTLPDQKVSPLEQEAQLKSALQVFSISLPQRLVRVRDIKLPFCLIYSTFERAQQACNDLKRLFHGRGIDLENLEIAEAGGGWFVPISQEQRLALLTLPAPQANYTLGIWNEFRRFFSSDKDFDKEKDRGPGPLTKTQ